MNIEVISYFYFVASSMILISRLGSSAAEPMRKPFISRLLMSS